MRTLVHHAKDYSAALDWIERRVSYNDAYSNLPEALTLYGTALNHVQKYNESLDAFKSALAHETSKSVKSEIMMNAGVVARNLGRWNESLSYLLDGVLGLQEHNYEKKGRFFRKNLPEVKSCE